MKSAHGRVSRRERRAESASGNSIVPHIIMRAESDDPYCGPYPVSTAKKKGGRFGPPPFKSRRCAGWLGLLRGDGAEDDAGQDADQHIVIADADPFLAATGTMQAVAAIVADRPVTLPAGIFLAVAPMAALDDDRLLHDALPDV